MKNIKFYFIFIIMGFMMIQLSQAQFMGKWIIPTTIGGVNNIVFELEFNNNGITYNTLPMTSANVPTEFSGGGYDSNYDTDFYVVGEYIYYNNSPNDWVSVPDPQLHPEYQIIQKPGDPGKYYSFYTSTTPSNRELDHHFSYNEIVPNQIPTQSNELRSGLDGYVAFSITPQEQLPIYLYASTNNSGEFNPPYPAGLRRWIINSSSVAFDKDILIEGQYGLVADDFIAYNMELKINNSEETVIAWIKGPNNVQDPDKLIVVIDEEPEIYDLGRGILSGIEFSGKEDEDNMLYVSCTGESPYNEGIVKVNYTTGQVVSTIVSNNYSHTFLQTAPDGHIYGVSNDGKNLCRINMQNGNFSANVFDFEYQTLENYVSTYREFYPNGNFYLLPENERQYVPLMVDVTPVATVCPGSNEGSVTIEVSGGVPFLPPSDPYQITCDPSVTFTWNDTEQAFEANYLYDGIYYFTINDNADPQNIINGSFEIEASYYDFNGVKEVTEDETWPSYNKAYKLGILIRTGVELTVTNSTLEFGPDAKIIVEPGAKLIVNNSTLTNLNCEPENKWQGVQVWGDASEHQYESLGNPCKQGKLILQNSSVIEHAILGVNIRNPEILLGTEGGIIIAKNSYFINNNMSVQFHPYQNYYPTPATPIDNLSYFYDCDFIIDNNIIIDEDFILPDDFEAHLKLHGVNGINIKGCRFKNDNTVAQNYGNGVLFIDAGTRFIDYCSSATQPCPPLDLYRNEFNNFYAGINGSAERSVHTLYVNHAEFNNNSYGVKLNNVNNATVIYSDFNIGPNEKDKTICFGAEPFGEGIELNGCTGFAIEENTFTKFGNDTIGEYVGIRCKDSHTQYDIIYKNTFEGLDYGNFAEGENREDVQHDDWGLEYRCNLNVDNNVDFMVTTDDPLNNPAMINGYQGYTNISAGNTFSQQSGVEWHFRNEGTQQIDYWWYTGNPIEEPEYYCNPLPEPCFFIPNPISMENSCPSHYGGGSGSERGLMLTPEQFQDSELDYLDALSDYNYVKTLYDNLEDGGNTQSLKSEVENALSSDMWQIRTELLGISPHVSKEVLVATAEKTDVFPESVLFEILAANPDELKNGDMISFLETKEDPLPAYMIDMLEQIAAGITYKTVLKRQMADFHAKKSLAAHDIIRSILADSVFNAQLFRNWLDNLDGMAADKQIVASYINEEDYTSAQALLDLMPALYDLEGQRLEAYNEYKVFTEFQMSLAQEDRNISELDSFEIDYLVDLADNSSGTAKERARGILEFAYGYHYCNCPPVDSTGLKSSAVTFDKPESDYGLQVTAKPNPADTWVAFYFNVPTHLHEAVLEITDVNGRTIYSFDIYTREGQKILDSRKIEPGIYFYTLRAGNFSKSKKLIIK